MERVELRKISGGYDVPGFGTVTRAALLRPSKTVRDLRGRAFDVRARSRVTSVTDATGAQVGAFHRSFWTRHGTLRWGQEQYEFRAGIWSSTYSLTRAARALVTVRLRVFGVSEMTIAEPVDPLLALVVVAQALITKSYAGASAAAGSGGAS